MSGLPTPPQSRPGSEESQAQKRAALQNDASTRADLPIDPKSNLALQGCTYERNRVGCPALRILPLESTPLQPDNQAHAILSEMRSRMEEIMSNMAVRLDTTENRAGLSPEIEFVYRTLEHQDPSPHNLTVLIPAQWDDSNSYQWLWVASAIRTLVMTREATRLVNIEIIGGPLLHDQVIEVVDPNHPIVELWSTIRLQVHSLIGQENSLRDHWCSIGVIRMGDYRWAMTGPEIPTVISIIVDWDVHPKDWLSTQNSIESLLSSYDLNEVEVCFSRGEVRSSEFPLVKPTRMHGKYGDTARRRDYADNMGMGADIGPERYFTLPNGSHVNGPSATMGGYINVTNLKTGQVERMGMTNWHAIREISPDFRYKSIPDGEIVRDEVPVDSELDLSDRSGVRPSSPGASRQTLSQIESPSRRKHNFTMANLASLLEKSRAKSTTSKKTVEYEAHYARLKAFFDDSHHVFGSLWAGSGFRQRTPDNGRLDWALIQFTKQNRLGPNTITPASEWPSSEFIGGLVPDAAGNTLSGMGKINDYEDVFAIGARTGHMCGRFNCIKSDVRLKAWDERPGINMNASSEHCFISRQSDKPFAGPGDSGSFVFDTDGHWVGLIHAGPASEKLNAGCLIYVTDANVLLGEMNKQYQNEYSFKLPEN